VIAAAAVAWLLSPMAGYAQLTSADLEALRRQAIQEGWTFEVGPSQATETPLEVLCGARPPLDAAPLGTVTTPMPPAQGQVDIYAARPLPSAFDWREVIDPPPIRSQGACNSCWAHAAIAPAEFAILIRDGVMLDLSEQWLISCSQAGSCQLGGWHEWAFDLFLPDGATDLCGQSGLVLESDAPYLASDGACDCPYPRPYFMDGWGRIPADVAAIKWHIYHYGPVATGVHAGAAFQAYRGGVFNACAQEPINHAVVLVGWDDTQGSAGVWIVRNSWGDDWGEAGYMRIEYGCSQINNLSNFVDYRGGLVFDISPADPLAFEMPLSDPPALCQTLMISNPGPLALRWHAVSDRDWAVLSLSSGDIPAGQSQVVDVCVGPTAKDLAVGLHEADIVLVDEANRLVEHRAVSLDVRPHSLLGHWAMDAIVDGQVIEATGSGRDLQVEGELMLLDGRFDQAASLSVPPGYLARGYDPALQPARSVSVAAWVRAEDLAGPEKQFLVHNAFRMSWLENGYMLWAADGRINWWVKTEPGGSMDTAWVSAAAEAGRWIHVAATYDGTRASLYLDAQLQASVPASGDIQWGPAPYRGLYVGAGWDGLSFSTFTGGIDDVRIYDYALSEEEIQCLYDGLPADFNEDWRIGLQDLRLWMRYWLAADPPDRYDFNHDRRIDLADLAFLAEGWGTRF